MSCSYAESKIDAEPDWWEESLTPGYDTAAEKSSEPVDEKPIMQTDALKPFFFDIGRYGLNYAYHKYKLSIPSNRVRPTGEKDLEQYKYTKTKHPKNVVIVGAGMSGLVAAYELAQVGHNVKIVEMQHRVGGRCRTFSKQYFFEGLWSDAGAMRIPSTGLNPNRSKHWLTDFYGIERFQLPIQKFQNQTDKGYYYLYGHKISTEEWNKDPGKYCDKFWKGWDEILSPEIKAKYKIKDIASYYNATLNPVMEDIRTANNNNPTQADWALWLNRWSRFSVNDFLRSTFDGVKQTFTSATGVGSSDLWTPRVEKLLQPLKELLTWPEVSILGFSAYNYNPGLDISLAELLRDSLGFWWEDPMHTFQGGMHSLPSAFMGPNTKGWNQDVNLSKNITFGAQAWRIYHGDRCDEGGVRVIARNDTTQHLLNNKTFEPGQAFSGDALIMTLPLNIIRQTAFFPPLDSTLADGLVNVFYSGSTKIMLQCKTKFWEKIGLYGGFSFTNLPIGQIHYPTNTAVDPTKTDPNERGVLMCYTWKEDALLFGSQTTQNAIAEAVDEIQEIHPEIVDNFEVGGVQAWYTDQYSQGAFALLKPFQVQNVVFNLMRPYPKNDPQIYFAGEAISFCNGWIQGALESGLRAAYQFYSRNEEKYA